MLDALQLLAGVLAQVRRDLGDRPSHRGHLCRSHLDLARAIEVEHDRERIGHRGPH